MAIRHIAVVVPAADEEDTIADCLAALAATRDKLAATSAIRVDVLVVLDGCRDGTADIVTAAGIATIDVAERSVGAARDLGSRAAIGSAHVRPDQVWTVHTDADSMVPPNWLPAHLERAERGAGLVLGTVEPALEGPVFDRWRERHDEGDGHRHVHGANMGIRGDILLRLGGWPRLRAHEDTVLTGLAEADGVRIDRAGGLTVRTSARRRGRAPRGFSSYLRDLETVDALP